MAFYDLVGAERAKTIEHGQIEIAPLAFMRGVRFLTPIIWTRPSCTLTDEDVLTRMGYHSKVVVNGDISQTDLPPDHIRLEHAADLDEFAVSDVRLRNQMLCATRWCNDLTPITERLRYQMA